MTKAALSKLPTAQSSYCETLSHLISKFKENDNSLELERRSGELRGYLECLSDLGVISKSDIQKLYLWYSSEDRHNKVNSK